MTIRSTDLPDVVTLDRAGLLEVWMEWLTDHGVPHRLIAVPDRVEIGNAAMELTWLRYRRPRTQARLV